MGIAHWAYRCGCVLLLVGVLASVAFAAEQVAVRVDFPPGAGGEQPVPAAGGIPFPKGALQSVENVRLLGSDGKEVSAQVTRLAVWPDGSVKWALIDAVMPPHEGKALVLEYGADVTRAAVDDPITVQEAGDGVRVRGGGVSASVLRNGGGVFDGLTFAGGETLTAQLVLSTLRLKGGTSGQALPTNTYVCLDPSATLDEGKVAVDEV